MRSLIAAFAGWVCGYCGTSNPVSKRRCKGCGAEMW